ncbi:MULTISPECIES: type II toxin-antitoxin system RelE/ParE family toxin [Furfurilactobacillus]|uniref:Type II toxin-antitoxin system RelE/ParE family toxin n=1 Tax=Furfurilactobacillus rossiae TaxID=231049 RepID=A0A7C9IXA7_9LACO|nr:type II toxin-antitoxin system RelE/ParE family toxin [Furfurilactobacillus milii]MYV04575.1 type II toxin-antitoxin system RelE/ParE family toxin [Furfurilactobacillus milii]
MNTKPKFIPSDRFLKFLRNLSDKDRAKLVGTISLIESHELYVAIRQLWVKKIEDNLFEIRSIQSNNIRRAIYFHIEENNYFITLGFTKKSNKTPQRQIDSAKRIRAKYLRRNDNDKK